MSAESCRELRDLSDNLRRRIASIDGKIFQLSRDRALATERLHETERLIASIRSPVTGAKPAKKDDVDQKARHERVRLREAARIATERGERERASAALRGRASRPDDSISLTGDWMS